jgi:hypothetical protein
MNLVLHYQLTESGKISVFLMTIVRIVKESSSGDMIERQNRLTLHYACLYGLKLPHQLCYNLRHRTKL